ncbi:hypothetical protein Tco_1476424, partial [Tanacetum coccineum]
RDAAKIIQNCTQCQEQLTTKKAPRKEAIAMGSTWPFSHWGVNILVSLPTALGSMKYLAIASATNDQLKGRQALQRRHIRRLSGKVLWIHRTLPRNSQNETPFSLTYSSEAIIPLAESLITQEEGRTTKEYAKRKGGEDREVASIKEANCHNKLCKYHSTRSSHSTYKLGDFILLSLNNTDSPQVWQGPHMVRRVYEGELYEITDASDYPLTQIAKGTILHKFYM